MNTAFKLSSLGIQRGAIMVHNLNSLLPLMNLQNTTRMITTLINNKNIQSDDYFSYLRCYYYSAPVTV